MNLVIARELEIYGSHGMAARDYPAMLRMVADGTLRPGLLLALEPWVMVDTDELVTDADGWTLRSATGCRTAHSEHTIAITDDGAEILTLP